MLSSRRVWRPLRPIAAITTALLMALTMIAALTGPVSADGTETLGPPSIPIAEGTDVIAAGTGLFEETPDDITITVPAGVDIAQVLLYWEGQHSGLDGTGADDEISAGGISVPGTLIGGPTFFFNRLGLAHHSSTYRADITDLGLISAGATNVVSIDDIEFDRANNGAGILVIVDDGGPKSVIDVRDGNDLAFRDFEPPLQSTVPQTYTFPAATIDRTAELTIFASSVAGPDVPEPRPNLVQVTVGGNVLEFQDALGSVDGNEWDTLRLDITIPAGETEVTVQVLSVDLDETGNRPSSLAWNNSTLMVPPEPRAALGDYVWFDENEDGLQTGEDGVPDVTVNLWTAQPDGTLIANVATQQTGPDGGYFFDDLDPGQPYVVEFVAPDGFDFTTQDAGDDALDSDVDVTTGLAPVVVLAAGEENRTIDAGIFESDGGGQGHPHIHVEHEDMHLRYYKPEVIPGASEGKGIRLGYYWGKARYVFDGPPGVYTIMTDYWDENDGEAKFWLSVNGVRVDHWVADQDLGHHLPDDSTKVRRSVEGIVLYPGDVIKWKGKKSGYEYARLDMTWIEWTGEAPPPPPYACEAQIGTLDIRGVEVHSKDEHWDRTYAFYDRYQNLLFVTSDLTEAMDQRMVYGDRYEREWEYGDNAHLGYEPRHVYYVAEVDDDGVISALRRCSRPQVSPIGLDLDGSGAVERIDGEFAFDFDADGSTEVASEWFAPTEGILVDTTIGGEISGAHLFGDQGGLYANGYEKLAATRDLDGDGVVSGAELDGLVLWVDADSDAKLDAGETTTLAQHGIVSLSTSQVDMVSTAALADGSTMMTEDLWLPLVTAAGATGDRTSVVLLGLALVGLLGAAFWSQRRRRADLDRELERLLDDARSGH